MAVTFDRRELSLARSTMGTVRPPGSPVMGYYNLNLGRTFCVGCMPRLPGRQYIPVTYRGEDPLGMSCGSCGRALFMSTVAVVPLA